MPSRTIFLARLIGLSAVFMSLAMVVNKTSFIGTTAALVHEPPALMIYGMIALFAGLAMVIGHNVWSGGALAVVVTLIGWLILIRGVVLLSLSSAAIVSLFDTMRFAEFFYVYVAVLFAIGVYLTYASFRSSPSLSTGVKGHP
jgi:hypothetical protein